MVFARPLLVLGLTGFVSVAGLLAPDDAAAQQIFRSVEPGGRITFSDRPPQARGAQAKAAAVNPPARDSNESSSLPFELRQAAQAYPVTLFAGPECAPCDEGRSLLRTRGIPFAEKTVTSNEDIESLKRLVGVATLPVLAVGPQQVKGFSQLEWSQYLDAAGYPKTSQLPASYHGPEPTPLVAVQQVKRAPRHGAAPAEPPRPALPALPPPPPENGFHF